MPNISKEQIEQAMTAIHYGIAEIENITDEEYNFLKSTKDMLQGLLAQPEGEPVGYVNGDELDNLVSDGLIAIASEPTNWRKTKLYTHPAPFTPITADMVTDEMAAIFVKLHYTANTDKQDIANAVNAWGTKK